MHAGDLVELAALVSSEGLARIDRDQRLSAAAIQRYWGASKCRLDRWSARLKSCRDRLDVGSTDPAKAWRAGLPVCREILASEILTRVWVAWSAAYDRRHRLPEAEPVARSIWIGHLDARRRALDFLETAPEFGHDDASQLDRLRRSSERWTDLLLAPYAARTNIRDLAHDAGRLGDFAADRSESSATAGEGLTPAIQAYSLRATYSPTDGLPTRNSDLNSEIAGAILSCFEPDWSARPLESASFWSARLFAVLREAEVSLDALLSTRALPS